MGRWGSSVVLLVCIIIGGATVLSQVPAVRARVRSLVRQSAPPPITPLALATAQPRLPTRPVPTPFAAPPIAQTATPFGSPTAAASALPLPLPEPSAPPATLTPAPPTPTGPMLVGGRLYDAYIIAATKDKQAYQYSCEFDAAWVIMETFGRPMSVEQMVTVIGVDQRVEPYIEETAAGFVIHGGDIGSRYSGDYTKNFLARSTGAAMRGVFVAAGLDAAAVHDRAGVEAALRSGKLVWMKTTVDFKDWRPATWITPEGQTFQTVLGNDHAVVVIGFNADSVVIRDVLGPTSSNGQRPYEYEVSWETFMRVWAAQSFDGLAVGPATTR